MQTTESTVRYPVMGAVLCGGAGSRIGGCKAIVELNGRPLISYPLSAVVHAGLEPLVVAKPGTELPELDVRVIREPARDLHPLHGVIAALETAEGRPVVVVACDMPFVTAQLLAWLARLEGTAAPSTLTGLEPLLARYDPAVAPVLAAAALESRPARDAVAALRPRRIATAELAVFGDPRRLLFNVNDRRDLERAGTLLARARPGWPDPRRSGSIPP